ncbi:MAG: tetratricopeptide repeat protein, partial [Promethearchaeota archaeon]
MELEESEEDLLQKALEEEKAYNWVNALKLYDQAAKSYIVKKKIVKAMEIFEDLNKKSFLYGYCANTAEEYLEVFNTSYKLFKEGAALFKQNGNELENLELEACSFYYSITIAKSFEEAERMGNKSLGLISNLFETYSKRDDKQIPLRIIFYLIINLSIYTRFCKKPEELKSVSKRIIELSRKAWKLSVNSGDIFYIFNSLYSEFDFLQVLNHIDSKWLDKSKEAFKDCLNKCEECIKFLKTYNDPFLLTILYYIYGCIYCEYGHKHIDDEIEQRNYFERGLKYLEMSLDLARELKNKYHIVFDLYFINQYAFLSGKFMYLQKRIMNDIKEIREAGKIFAKSRVSLGYVAYFFMNYLPAFYYSNISQLSFFTRTQRKSYAKKGIEYGLRTLGGIPTVITESFSFISLTFSYAVLARFSESKEEQDMYIKYMFDYANKSKNLGEKYGGGVIQSFAYNSLNRAYKTLADSTENKQERIKMLSIAADASKNYLKCVRESRSGIIAAQMRLALLYEEIGIFTKDEEILNEAKELLQDALKSSLDKGYFSYAATTYEYIARIEDRLGNHTASAENYLKAQKNHEKSMEGIEYRPLKERVKEKIQYAHAWALVEEAKAYHKNENHLKAKECYEHSSNILKKIPKYYFEGFYNVAWAMLEEAELLSKQEKQEEAINKYKKTIQAFEETIRILKEASAKSKEQPEKERIEKLEKVAEVRINYCSA